MRRSQEMDALQFEGLADERVQVDVGDDDIAAQHARAFVHQRKGRAQGFENFLRKKSDLALVVIFVIEEAIAPQSAAGDAFDLRDFLQRMIVRRLAMVPKKIVAGRDEDLADEHEEILRRTRARASFGGRIIRRAFAGRGHSV